MDFNLKQWRDESEQEEDQKPKLLLNSNPHSSSSSSSALPLFFSEPNSNLSVPYSSEYHHPNTPSVTKFHKMGSYFSTSQWQELELQALIFRHMIAGAVIPTDLLHLVKKSLINSPSSPYYQYYSHYQPALLQSGYWGRAAMDPEPGRCRRTDGKKWRCSRDVVSGQKYCERHVHRGRNRSRKPVENTTPAAGSPYVAGGSSAPKTNSSVAGREVAVGGGGGTNCFTLTTSSTDLLHINQRSSDSIIETNGGQSSGRTLRHFFDDWSKPLQETDNAANYSATNLSISMPGNPSSDFSLKLGTGIGDEPITNVVSGERDNNNNNDNDNDNNNNNNKPQVNWDGMAWENNPVAPMGGPLAEALRSSMSNSSSPTSVLHRLQRGNVSETSYAS